MSNLVLGNLTWDRLITVESIPAVNQDVVINRDRKFAGGAAANVASTIALLGKKACLAACVGGDEAGKALIDNITSFGVSTTHIVKVPQRTSEFLCIMDNTGDRSFYLNFDEAAFKLNRTDIMKINLSDHASISFVGCSLKLAMEILPVFSGSGTRLYANLGFWIASGELATADSALLWNFNALFMNKAEFLLLPDKMRALIVSEEFLGASRQVIVTGGHEETVAYSALLPPVIVRPDRSTKMVNPLGCGDAFMGGYLVGLERGFSVTQSCILGHKCATSVLSQEAERDVSQFTFLAHGSLDSDQR